MHGAPLSPIHRAAQVLAQLDALATCSEPHGGLTRLFLTPEHRQAIGLVRGWMQAAGLDTHLDDAGTLIGRMAGNGPVLLLGSHIDTVRNAGRYDGCLGVALAIALADGLHGTPLPYRLEVRAFGDEEGVRFPVTLTGARATAGTFDPATLTAKDAQGITLEAALHDFGLDPTALANGVCTARDAFAYLEIHIEQGPVLEAAGTPLGIVTAINGAARFMVELTGLAGHAGTVPMDQRRDALAAAAEMVLAVRRIAGAHSGVVGTVGQLRVSPGAPNVIPGACVFSIDLRAPQDGLRHRAETEIRTALQAAAAAHDVTIRITQTHAAPAVACDTRLQAVLALAITAAGLPVLHLPSGAGHDAMAVAALCPVGMLFIRCTGGISHHPDEAVTTADVAAALGVMADALRQLNPADFS